VKTLTLRGLSPILKRAIQDRAAQKRISLPKAAIELLEEDAGIRKAVEKCALLMRIWTCNTVSASSRPMPTT
jgi:hypothetical protein